MTYTHTPPPPPPPPHTYKKCGKYLREPQGYQIFTKKYAVWA
jgi:hypothetical protein